MNNKSSKQPKFTLFVIVGCLQVGWLPLDAGEIQHGGGTQPITNKLLDLCIARDRGVIGTNAFVVETKEMQLNIELPILLDLRDHKISTDTLMLLWEYRGSKDIPRGQPGRIETQAQLPHSSSSQPDNATSKEPGTRGDGNGNSHEQAERNATEIQSTNLNSNTMNSPANNEASAKRDKAPTPPTPTPKLTNSAFMGLIHLSSGASFQNPYTVTYDSKQNTSTLQKNGNEVAAFLDFSLINRSVLDTNAPDWAGKALGGRWVKPWEEAPDFTMQIGFMFGNSTGPTNYSASTIVGSGDFYTQAAIGLPFWRRFTGAGRHQLTLELAGGAITDSDFVSVYPNVFMGLGYQLGFKSFAEHRPGLLSARFGAGRILVPTAQDLDVSTPVTGMSGLFYPVWEPAFGTQLVLPIKDWAALTVGANIYMKTTPAAWNMSVGATIPFETIANVFK